MPDSKDNYEQKFELDSERGSNLEILYKTHPSKVTRGIL